MTRSGLVSALLLALALAGGACSGFETIAADAAPPDAAADLPERDAGVDLARSDQARPDLPLPDLPLPDQGPPPPTDFPCGSDYWIHATKTDAKCAPRRVMQIDANGLFVNHQVAIAVDAKGQIGIAYDNGIGPDEGVLRLVSFPVGATSVPTPDQLAGTQFDRFGVRLALVPKSTGGGFHLAYVELGPQGGELNYAPWPGTGNLPGAAELLSTEVTTKGSVDLVEASDGRVHAVYFANVANAIYSRVRPKGGGVWSKPVELASNLSSTVYDHGHIAMVRHAGGGPALAWHMGSGVYSNPRFRRFDTTLGWSSKKTIDNPTVSGIAGQSIDLAITQLEHYAAYFAVPAGSKQAELRLATWASFNDTPQITVLEQSIPADFAFVQYELALGVDQWGLLHLAVLLPSNLGKAGTMGTLEYHRQHFVAGKKVWIKDIVDNAVFSEYDQSHVALWVEPHGRPHIVYYNAQKGSLLYATRDDR